MKIRPIHIMSAVAVLFMTAPSFAQNLFVNGSFESASIGAPSSGNSISTPANIFPGWLNQTQYIYWGNNFAGIAASDGNMYVQFEAYNGLQLGQTLALSPNNQYQLTFDTAAAATTIDQQLEVQIGEAGAAQPFSALDNYYAAGLTSSWTQHSITFTTAASGSNNYFFLFNVTSYDPSGPLLLDNIALVAVPEPSTYASLFGVISLCFVIWWRRR